MLLIVLPSLSTLVAPQALVARHKADNHVLNHIVRNAIVPPPNGKKSSTQAAKQAGRGNQESFCVIQNGESKKKTRRKGRKRAGSQPLRQVRGFDGEDVVS